MLSGSNCDFIIYYDTNYSLESVAIYTIGFNTFPNSPDYLLMFTELCIHFQKKKVTPLSFMHYSVSIFNILFPFKKNLQPCL